MNRRQFHLATAALLAAPALPAWAQAPAAADAESAVWAAIEARSGGRLGVAVMQAGGPMRGHRLGERFPMCSTFKWLAAAHVLHRVDAGEESLARRLPVRRHELLPHTPITQRHAGGAMTLGELCRAAVTVSDNAAANLILGTLGGPAGLTAYARDLGDMETRLDRTEPTLNEAAPGDPRDTTTPRAMAGLLHTALVGSALSAPSRARLARWLEASQTNGQRLRAALPAGWRMGSKTGTGNRGSTNDVGIFWPPGRAPILVAAYLTETEAGADVRNAALAAVAAQVARIGGAKQASSSDRRASVAEK